jgi:hypothetical protein
MHKTVTLEPEVALIDIHDSNTGLAAGPVLFDMTNITQSGVSSEAGMYAMDEMTYEGLYINYTSVTGQSGSGFDTTRQIDVQMEAGSTFPLNVDLRITPEAPIMIDGGGTVNSAGSITAGGVALGATVPVGTDAMIVSSIESVYTGDETYGVKLVYSLEQNGNFAGYRAGLYEATLRYTFSDF